MGSVKKAGLAAKYVFIKPPSMEELEDRLRGRGTETEEKIQKRLANAAGEMAYAEKEGFYDQIIVNDELEAAYAALCKFLGLGGTETAATGNTDESDIGASMATSILGNVRTR